MKANELMAGNWVRSKKWAEKPFKITRINEKEKYYYGITSDGKQVGPFLIEELEPITLTTDILEKNGFEKVYDKHKLPNYRIKLNSYTDLYFTVFTGVDGYWNPVGLGVLTGGIPATVDYVHQLQHALRLCRIKKEIEL